ncbi:MAG: mechanosensitive ion channel family protein [Deferribacteraceae bacterium]|jgi:small-conductance mechanosensitive channel|nr:mechanosensitive ion channel family protein [Deferribacteraceae bacterium]
MFNIGLDSIFFENTIRAYLTASGILVLFITVFVMISKISGFFLEKVSDKATNSILTMVLCVDKKLQPILWYLPFYIASRYLILPVKITDFISMAGMLIVTVCVVRYAIEIIKAAIGAYIIRTGGSPLLSQSVGVIANIFLWVMAALFLLSNFGFNVTTLITGLGIGGMAIALASQTLLGDLFNYFTIIIDRPFTIGDNVKVDGVTGVVQSIGLKGTRLRALSGEQVILSNTDMTKGVLLNFRVMDKRRVLARIGIRYDTPAEVVKEIPDLIKNVVQSVDGTDFERAHLSEFGDSGLIYEIVYFVLNKDYNVYMDRLQIVNFRIIDEFARLGVDFAFPSQSIYIEK